MAKKDKQDGNLTTLTVVGGGVQVDTVDHAEVRQRVRELKARVEQDGWDLSVALWEIYDGALYQAWGFAGWSEYVEQELEFKLRKAQYYVAVQQWVRAFAPEFVEWVKACGLAKARLMSPRVTPDEAQLWRNRLDGKTYREMEAILSGADPDEGASGGDGGGGDGDGGDGGKGTRVPPFKVNLAPEQRANVDAAIAQAKVQAETDSDGHALDLICTDYRAGNGHFKDKLEYLAAAERTLGLRVVAFKNMADGRHKVVYGQEFIDALDEEDAGDSEK